MTVAVEGGMRRGAAVAALRRAFAAAGLDNAAGEARALVAAALRVDTTELLIRPDTLLGDDEARRLSGFAGRRLGREPVQRILGEAEFWGLPFRLGPETLVPRPDTETLVAEALSVLPDRAASPAIVDLGTGSGCILTALLHELPAARGLGIDRSPAALAIARANAIRNGVGARAFFVVSDWAAAVAGTFDLVVSNPPYIRSRELPGLAPEVAAFDPETALDGGPDGLDAYRAVLKAGARLVATGGHAVLEIGHDQEWTVAALSREHGFEPTPAAKDLGGRARVLVLTRPP